MPILRLDCGIWVVDGDTHRTQWIKEKGSLYIDCLIGEICKLINLGDTVIDVGANIGDHTFFYIEAVGPSGEVIAFEPDPECYACCVLNCGTFRNIFPLAASSESREYALHKEANRGQNYLEEGAGVKSISIDSLGLERVDLIKIDVEGHELLVLQGAVQTIARCRPKLVIEMVEDQLKRAGACLEDLKELLESLGYAESSFDGGGRDRLFVPDHCLAL